MRGTSRLRRSQAGRSGINGQGRSTPRARREERSARRLQLETLEPRQLLTVMVDRIGLAEDTGVSATDRITSRPELVGHVVSYMPTGNVRVEFDHQGDGVAEGSAPVAADQTFRYDPRQFDSRLATYQGPVNIRYRPLRLNNAGQVEFTGWWQSFAFTLEGPPPADFQVRDLHLVFDTGSSSMDGRTSDPTIQGRVVDARPGSSSPRQVVVQLDHNGDGAPEASLSTGSSDSFTYAPRGLAAGPVTLSARALQWDEGLSTYLQGPWAALSFVLEPPPAGEVTGLRLEDNPQTVGGAAVGGVLLTGRLNGTSDQVAGQQVEIDLDGNGLADLTAITDDAGNFTRHLIPAGPGELTVRVRGTRYDAGLDATGTGDWTAAAFRVEPLATPSVADWQVVDGVVDHQGRLVAGAAVVSGSLAGVLDDSVGRVEWDHDGDGQVDGTSSLDVDGQFLYRLPDAQPGEIVLHARGAAWDHRLLTFQVGAWQSLAFTLTAPRELPSLVPRLTLRHDTGTSAADGVTSDPTVIGTLDDGMLGAWVTLELDFDQDGQFDDTVTADARGQFEFTPPVELGPNTVQVRARQWDAARRQGSLGPWTQLSFAYELPEAEPPVIEFFSLASDSGPSRDDGVTANSLLVGRLAASHYDESVVDATSLVGELGAWIELDVNGDGVADQQVVVDERGEFAFEPGPLQPGTYTVSARAIQWDLARQAEVAGPWVAATFTMQPQVAAPAIITQLELVSETDGGVTGDVVVRGRIVNENALHGVTVELDASGDGMPDQTTTTDRLGRFELSPASLPDGMVELRFRTRELDPANGTLTFGQWTVLGFENTRAAARPLDLAWLALAEDTGPDSQDGRTWIATVIGQVDQMPASIAGVSIQFDHDRDGIVDGSADVDQHARFVYEPVGLLPGAITLAARTRYVTPQQTVLIGEWQPLTFELESAPRQGAWIERFELAHDTGHSATDASTADPAVQGRVAGQGAAGVWFDTDGDWAGDVWVELDASGNFAWRPADLQPGLIQIQVRPGAGSDPSVDDPDWVELRFVLAEQPDSDAAQRLLVENQAWLAARSQARQSLDDSLRQAEQARLQALHTALQAHDELLVLAAGTRDQALAAAEQAYWESIVAAEQAHAARLEAAGGRLVAELGSAVESGSMIEVSYVPWAWPAAPLAESQQRLLAADLPSPTSLDALHLFDGRPDYGWSSDLEYGQDLAQAGARRDSALSELDQQYLADLNRAADEHRQAVHAAEQAYLAQVRSAQAEHLRTLAAANPPLDPLVIDQQRQQQVQDAAEQLAAAERQHAQDYETALRASQQVENTEIAAARQAYEDSNRAAGERFFDLMANPFLSAAEQEAARHEYISTLAGNEVILATAIAAANQKQRELAAAELQRMSVRNADAQRDYEQAVAQADSLLAQRQAELSQWQGVTQQQADHALRQAMAAAQRARQLALHAAEQQHLVAVAEATTRRDQGRAAAERQYQEDVSSARQGAVDALHQFEAGAWSEYQRSLADSHVQFVISQGTAAEAYVRAVSNANLRQVVAAAAAQRAQADRSVEAELETELAWSDGLLAFSLEELAADRERGVQHAELWRRREEAFATAEHTLQLQLAERRYAADLRHALDEGERTIAIGQLTADELWHYDAVQHERRMAVIEHTRQIAARDSGHTYLLAGIAARQAQDEAQAAATRDYEQGYASAERARQERVTDARQRFEQAAAELDREYRQAMAQAAGVTDIAIAQAESLWRMALAEADASLVFDTTDAGGRRLAADERALAESALNLAEQQAGRAARQAAAAAPGQNGYQVESAEARRDLAAAVGDALVQRVEEVTEAQTAWVRDSNLANTEFARMAAEAYQQQVETTVAAADTLAEDAGAGQLNYDLLVAERHADRDRLVVGAGHELEVDLADSREALSRTYSQALRNYDREEAHARRVRERSLQDALLQARLGSLAPGQYELLVQAAHQTYADHLDSAGYVRRRAEAAAEETRANQEAITRQQWTEAVGGVLVNWTAGLGAAAETLAETLEQASVAFAQVQAEAGLDFATETAAAEYLRTVATAIAEAERQNLLAAADASLDVALVEQAASAELRDTQARSANDVASLAHYAAHYLASATENPTALSEYRRAAAESELTWAESVSEARSAYLQARLETTVAYAQATNDADQLHALATTTANVILADGRATADRTQTVDYSRAVGQRAVEQSRAMLEQGRERTGALSEFRTDAQQARQDYELRFAEARTAWVARVARAEAERYVSQQSSDAQSRFAAAKAEADAQYLAAAQAARVILAAELGDAEIARVSRDGDAEVARAQAFGDAGQVFAEAAGDSTTIFTALATGHEEQWVQATSRADAERVKNLAAAEARWVAESSAAVTTWQAALGLAHEDYAAAQAVAAATYHVAQSVAAAERLPAGGAGGETPGLVPSANAAAAYAGWIAELSDDYASFARATASADAAQRVQLAQAAADLDLARVANEGRLIGQQADLDFTRDHNRIALWGNYEQVLVHHENLLRELTAAADGALDVRRAEAARQLALDRAHAARQRDVALALGEAGALDQFDVAVIVAEARRDATLAHAGAEWTGQVVEAQSQFTTDHVSAMHALRTGLATLDQRYQVDLAGAFRSQQTSDAAAEADYAIAEFEAIGQLRVRLAAAISSWQSAELAAEADARDRLDAELGTPASQFSAEMAAARSAWWQQQALPLEGWVHAVHGIQMTYQHSVADAYEQHAASVAAAGAAWLSGAADAVLSARLDDAAADQQNQATYNAADTRYLLALAAAQGQRQAGLAEVRARHAGGGDSAEFQQALQAVQEQFEAARHDAWLDYAASAVGAEDQRRADGAFGERNLLVSLADSDEQFWGAMAAAGDAYQAVEATAHATRQDSLADEHAAWRSQAADLLFAELEQRALTEDSAWLRFAADAWDAERRRDEALTAAGFILGENTFDAQRLQQQSQRSAEQTLLAGTLAAEGRAAIDQAAARLEHTLADAGADATHPQASLPALAPPQLPQLPAGHQRPIEEVDDLETATPGAELMELPLWSGFAGPHVAKRWSTQLLRAGLVQTGRPAEEVPKSRHGAHLVVDASRHSPGVDGAQRTTGGPDAVALSISQLLALAQVPLLTDVADPAELPATARKQLRLAQLVLRGAPDASQFQKLDEWLEAEQAYRQQLGRDVMQHSSDAQRALWFALRQEVAADYFDQLRPDHGAIGAPVNPWEFARQIDEAHFQSLDFWERRQTLRHWDETTNQFWMGAYTKDVTVEGTVGEIAMSLSGLDLPMDVRDLHYQASHWEWTWAHAGKTALYGVSLLPVIGVVKNLKHVEHLKHVDPVASAARHAQPVPGLEAAADAGTGIARQADDSRLLLQTGGEACFVAGTLVMVAPDAGEAAVEDAGLTSMPGWRHWTSIAMIAAGSGLLARLGLQLARPRGRDLDDRLRAPRNHHPVKPAVR
ncbi:MAG: hypothetical protein J5I93_14775 [Pirellulaceae bacterium]|nr:hypothetical protein [Pirellulaceae bacterium]